MHLYFVATFFLGVLATLMHTTSSSVISCPPNNLPEAGVYLRQLCSAIKQAINDNAPPEEQFYFGGNNKRQDVDHVFLRFGRRMGFE